MKQIVIIENDSSESKIGFAGEKEPRFVFPTIFGEAKLRFPPPIKEYYNPDEALQYEEDIIIRYPIEKGVMDDWVTMVRIWDFSFENKLKIDRKLHPVLMIIHPSNSRKHRQKIADIFFETYEVPALCIKDQSYLINFFKESKVDTAWTAGSLFAASESNFKDFIKFETYWEIGPDLIP